MTYRLYNLTVNGKVFYERTALPIKMEQFHEERLKEGTHWNKLMQTEYDESEDFQAATVMESSDPEKIATEFYKKINDDQAILATHGYNMFWDRKRKPRQRITAFDTDLIYLKSNGYTLKEIKGETGASLSSITFRINRNLNKKKKVSTHEDFKLLSLHMLFLQEEALSASRIINKMYHYHDISDSFATSSKQLTRFFKQANVEFERKNGTNLYKTYRCKE